MNFHVNLRHLREISGQKGKRRKIDVLLFLCLSPTENHSKIAYFRAIFFYFIKQNASQCLKFGVS